MRRSVKEYLGKLFKEFIVENIQPNTPALPIGYNPMENIRGALFHWIKVPFNGNEIWCQLRCLNQSQIEACGDVTSIMLKAGDEKPTREKLIEMRNFQEKICEAVFNIPKFDNIVSVVGDNDFVISEKKQKLENIKKKIDDNRKILSVTQIKELETRLDELELFTGFLLPTDTMDFVTFWAMGHDISEVKKLSRNTLLGAAILADRNKGAPTDYLSGVYTDHNKNDINRHAWIVFGEYTESKRAEIAAVKGGKGFTVGGPKSNKG